MRSGYILLEIIIAIALGALILSALWLTFFQVNSAYKTADRWIGIDTRAAIVQHQLDRDISGAFIPTVLVKSEKKTEKKPEKSKQDNKKEKANTEKKKVESKPLEKSFYSKNKNNNLQYVTFITSNPLQVYGNSKPRVARVTYFVSEEKSIDQKSSYKLIRQETETLKFRELKEGTAKGQEVAAGIKSISVEYSARPVKKDDKDKDSVSASAKPEATSDTAEYKKFKVWGEAQIKDTGKQSPNFVTITVSFWDKLKKRSQQFIFRSDIVAGFVPEEKTEKKKQEEKPKQKPKEQKGKQPAVVGIELKLGGSK